MPPTVVAGRVHGDDVRGNRRASLRPARFLPYPSRKDETMTAYAVAHLRTVDQNAEIVD
jgi:hypothetical protein